MWTVLDHTADVRLAVEAPSWAELLEEAAAAFGAWMSGGKAPVREGQTERSIEVRGRDAVETWVHFWKALHRLWTVEELLPIRAEVEAGASATDARARVGCLEVGDLDLAALTDVKAVTWHGAGVEQLPGRGWRATIVLDV